VTNKAGYENKSVLWHGGMVHSWSVACMSAYRLQQDQRASLQECELTEPALSSISNMFKTDLALFSEQPELGVTAHLVILVICHDACKID